MSRRIPIRQVAIPRDLPLALRLSLAGDPCVHALHGETMGTTWAVKFVAPKAFGTAAVRQRIERALGTIVALMSTWLPDSNISRFNRAPAGTWHDLPAEFLAVLQHALTVARETGGAFDPTVGALVDAWGFGPTGRRDAIPSPGQGAATRGAWQRITLSSSRAFQPGGIVLDFSGIAKGYAVDCVADTLATLGLTDHLAEIGGELRGSGTKPDGSPWWVALEAAPGLPETVVALHGLAAATSGDAQRFFMHEGRRLSHTIDPRTGRPVSDRLAAVTVLHRSCMHADALATALTVLGPDGGHDYAAVCGIAARFLLRRSGRFEERLTPAFAAMLDQPAHPEMGCRGDPECL